MDSDILVEKLTFQFESIREGFDILSKARDFKEMTKTFAHLLRGNFSLKDIFLLHKTSPDSEWLPVGFSIMPDNSIIKSLDNSNNFEIHYYQDNKISAAVILPLLDLSYLGLLIGKKIDGKDFSDLDKISLQILLQVFDSAHKAFINRQNEKKLIFDLNEKVFQLSNLIDTGIELSKLEKRNTLYRFALERVSSLTNASSGILKISPADKNAPVELHTFPEEIAPGSILKNKFKIESAFSFMNRKYELILSEKEIRGGTTSFTDLDKLLLESVARQLSASIENEFLHLESIEKERIEKELNLAASIQQQIIPKKLTKIKGYDIDGINIPSKEVGGDYYDCIRLKNGNYAFIIADVAGKGIAAALLVSTLNAALNSYLEFDLPLTQMSDKLNTLIFKATPPDKYITFFIAVLEPVSGSLEIVNAGHNPILLLKKDNTLQKIDAGGTGLGMLDLGIPFLGEKIVLNPGDKLFLYTDGIPEAMNEEEEEYSEGRMINFLKSHAEKTAEEFTKALVEDVKLFVKEAPQSDDITLLILKRN